jgi:hypothetical protein
VVSLINFFRYNLEVAQKGSVESSSTAPRRGWPNLLFPRFGGL